MSTMSVPNPQVAPRISITINDLLHFKEELLKDLRQYETITTQNINNNFTKYEELLERAASRLSYFEKDKASFMSKSNFIDERQNIISEIGVKLDLMNEKISLNDNHITKNQRDFANVCYRYDKVISDNLLIPGIIGNACKYSNLREYLLACKEEYQHILKLYRETNVDLNNYKKKIDLSVREINSNLNVLEGRLKFYIDTKFNETVIKIEDLNNITDSKIDAVRKECRVGKTENMELKNWFMENEKNLIEEVKTISSVVLEELEKEQKYVKKMKKNIIELSKLFTYKSNNNANKQQVITQFMNMIMGIIDEYGKGVNINTNIDKKSNLRKKLSIDLTKNNNLILSKVSSRLKDYIEGKINAEDTKYVSSEAVRLLRKNSVAVPPNIQTILNYKRDSKILTNDESTDENEKNILRKKSFLRMSSGLKMMKLNSLNSTNSNEGNEPINRKQTFFRMSSGMKISQTNNLASINSNTDNPLLNFNSSTSSNKINNNRPFKNLSSEKNVIYETESENAFNFNEKKNNSNGLINKKFKRSLTNKVSFSQPKNTNNNIHKKLMDLNLGSKIQENENDEESEFELSKSKLLEKSMDNNNNDKNDNSNLYSNRDKDASFNSISKRSNFERKFSESFHLKNEKINNNNISNNIDDKNNNNNDIIKENNNTSNNITNANNNCTVKNTTTTSNNNTNVNNNKSNNNSLKSENQKKNNNNVIKSHKKTTTLDFKSNDGNIKKNLKRNFNINKSKEDLYKNKNVNIKIIYSPKNENNITSQKLKNTQTSFNNTTNNFFSNTKTLSSQAKKCINFNKLTLENSTDLKNIPKKTQTKSKININMNNYYDGFDSEIDFKNRYVRDEDIIDIPLLVDPNTFKVDESKGSLENKIMELEFFTKKKLDELVREIKNFIPIHFNSHIKNYTVQKEKI